MVLFGVEPFQPFGVPRVCEIGGKVSVRPSGPGVFGDCGGFSQVVCPVVPFVFAVPFDLFDEENHIGSLRVEFDLVSLVVEVCQLARLSGFNDCLYRCCRVGQYDDFAKVSFPVSFVHRSDVGDFHSECHGHVYGCRFCVNDCFPLAESAVLFYDLLPFVVVDDDAETGWVVVTFLRPVSVGYQVRGCE